jgi:hypothetical protein
MPNMTNEEYIKNVGLYCPKCNSGNIAAELIRVSLYGEELDACARVECHDCQAVWQDLYTMTGYEMLEEEGEPNDNMDGDHESALASAGFGTDEDYGGGTEKL